MELTRKRCFRVSVRHHTFTPRIILQEPNTNNKRNAGVQWRVVGCVACWTQHVKESLPKVWTRKSLWTGLQWRPNVKWTWFRKLCILQPISVRGSNGQKPDRVGQFLSQSCRKLDRGMGLESRIRTVLGNWNVTEYYVRCSHLLARQAYAVAYSSFHLYSKCYPRLKNWTHDYYHVMYVPAL